MLAEVSFYHFRERVSASSSAFWIFSNTFQVEVPSRHEANYLFPPTGFVFGFSWHRKISALYILARIHQMPLLPAPPSGKSKSHFLSKELASQVGAGYIVSSHLQCLPKVYAQFIRYS